MNRILCLGIGLTVLLAAGRGSAPSSTPRETIGPPLARIGGLVASFGEYRPDHLHPGVDFSTEGKTGFPVHAAAQGLIYRLKVEWRGYGRALYLRHADGRISVYAHLERYEDRALGLERRVFQEKRRRGVRYPGDIFLDPPVAVKRGAVIGYSGESGSGLPHLHFEIRREDQVPADPLPQGWVSEESIAAPVFESVAFLSDAPGAFIEGVRYHETTLTRNPEGIYVPSRPMKVTGPFLPQARIYAEDGQGHRFGIKSLRVRLDGLLIYQLRLESFHFGDYPKVGLLLDHARSRMSPPSYTYFLVRLPGNDLGMPEEPENPVPELAPGPHLLDVEAAGPLGRVSRASIPFGVLPEARLQWEQAEAGETLRTLRFGRRRDELGPDLRLTYSLLGDGATVSCLDGEELPDGQRCRFDLPPGARGITAQLEQAQIPLGRATLFLPMNGRESCPLPPLHVLPSRHFVDLHLQVPPGGPAPTRILLRSAEGESRWSLVEDRPGGLLGSLPGATWKEARSVGIECEGRPSPRPTELPLEPAFADPGKAASWEACGIRLELSAGSVFSPTPVACEAPDSLPPGEKGMELLGRPIRLLPEALPLARTVPLVFPLPSGESHPERVAVYRRDTSQREWAYLGGERERDRIVVKVGRFGTFALFRDDSPPRILGVEPADPGAPASRMPIFKVRADDRGSGLNFDGVHIRLGGVELEADFDPDRGWSTASPSTPLTPGKHPGTAWAVDRSGNRSEVVAFEVTVR